MLSFESPNPKPEPERNLRCQPHCRATTSSTPAATADTQTPSAATNSYPSTSTATAAPAAANRWTISITACWPATRNRRNKKMPPSANWTAQSRLRRGTRSGRRNGVWLRHALRGLLVFIQEQIWIVELYLCRDASHSPIAYALRPEWHFVSEQLSQLRWPSHLLDKFCIFFDLLIHAHILNAAFSLSQTVCLAKAKPHDIDCRHEKCL